MQQPPAPNPENPASQSGQLYPQAGETPLPPQQVYQQPPMQQMPPNYQAAPLASSGSWPPQPQAYQPQAAAVNINMHAAAKQGPNGCLRVIYFFFIGWWLGLTCLEIGFALCFFYRYAACRAAHSESSATNHDPATSYSKDGDKCQCYWQYG